MQPPSISNLRALRTRPFLINISQALEEKPWR
uniref:Uncharacterized protein n=1 Tax=Anguilla anguilla TaxID=7936 RepID=A0A0E9W0N0_ANGAN